jgi:hypothetical protein
MGSMFRHLPLLSLLALGFILNGCDEAGMPSALQARGGGAEYDDGELPPLAPGDDDDDAATSADDDDATNDDDSDPNYALDIVSIHPEPNTDTHHYRQPIVVGFNGYAAGVGVQVSNEDGDTLATIDTWNDDFTELTIQPYELYDGSAFMQADHRYEVGVDIASTSLSWAFSTSTVGSQVIDTDGLQGNTYAVDFSAARSTTTVLLADLIRQVQGPTWLWQIDLSEGNIDFNSGVGTEDETDSDGFNQDLCAATGLVGGADADVDLVYNPYFASAPGDFKLWLDGVQIYFEEGWIDGDFLDDGTQLVEVGFRGWLREDSMEPLVGTNACSLLASHADLACEPCPSGAGQCAWVDIAGVSGVQTGLELAPVDADGDCADDEPMTVLTCSAAGRSTGLWLLLPLAVLIRRR